MDECELKLLCLLLLHPFHSLIVKDGCLTVTFIKHSFDDTHIHTEL